MHKTLRTHCSKCRPLRGQVPGDKTGRWVCGVCGQEAESFISRAHDHYLVVYPCCHVNLEGMGYAILDAGRDE